MRVIQSAGDCGRLRTGPVTVGGPSLVQALLRLHSVRSRVNLFQTQHFVVIARYSLNLGFPRLAGLILTGQLPESLVLLGGQQTASR